MRATSHLHRKFVLAVSGRPITREWALPFCKAHTAQTRSFATKKSLFIVARRPGKFIY